MSSENDPRVAEIHRGMAAVTQQLRLALPAEFFEGRASAAQWVGETAGISSWAADLVLEQQFFRFLEQ